MSDTQKPIKLRASFKTAKTNNIGIYDACGYLVATIAVDQLARREVIDRYFELATLMARAPDMHAALQSSADSLARIALDRNDHELADLALSMRAAARGAL